MRRYFYLLALAMIFVVVGSAKAQQQPQIAKVEVFGHNTMEIYGTNLADAKLLIDGYRVSSGPVFNQTGHQIAILANLPPVTFSKHQIKVIKNGIEIVFDKEKEFGITDQTQAFVVSDSLIFIESKKSFRTILPVVGNGVSIELKFTSLPQTVSIHPATAEDMVLIQQTGAEQELVLSRLLRYIVIEGQIDNDGRYTAIFELRDSSNKEFPARIDFAAGVMVDDGFTPVIKKVSYDKDSRLIIKAKDYVGSGQIMVDGEDQSQTTIRPRISGRSVKLESVIELQPAPWIDEIRVTDPKTLRFSEPAYLER